MLLIQLACKERRQFGEALDLGDSLDPIHRSLDVSGPAGQAAGFLKKKGGQRKQAPCVEQHDNANIEETESVCPHPFLLHSLYLPLMPHTNSFPSGILF